MAKNSYVILFCKETPNGLRYPRVGGRGQGLGAGKTRSQKKSLKIAQNPTRRVHALLGGGFFERQIIF
jgi:hypothetical protein